MAPISYCLDEQMKTSKKRRGDLKYASHQFYIDDLKLYPKDRMTLQQLIQILKEVLPAIGVKLNEKKCAIRCYRNRESTECVTDGEIPEMTGSNSYEYLRI